MKSYNVQALRGHQYDDSEFQADMKEIGINIPDGLLYKPELGPYVINEVYKQSLTGLPGMENPTSGSLYTPEEAKAEAETLRKSALDNYNTMLSI
jgi:hypothetical protein